MIHITEKHHLSNRLTAYLNGVRQTRTLEIKVPKIANGKEVDGQLLNIMEDADGNIEHAKKRKLFEGEIIVQGVIAKWVKGKVRLDIK